MLTLGCMYMYVCILFASWMGRDETIDERLGANDKMYLYICGSICIHKFLEWNVSFEYDFLF